MKLLQFDWPIIGNQHITSYLQNVLTEDEMSHAYLFVGPSGVGKKTLARYFVQSLICNVYHTKSHVSIPCNACNACLQFRSGIYPDLFQVKSNERSIGIEDIRALKTRWAQRSLMNSHKIAFLFGAQNLSLSASNALLKILEEPSGKSVFILTADNLSGIPETIISRCVMIRFRTVSYEDICKYLLNHGTDRIVAQNVAKISSGRVGIAIRLAQNPMAYNNYKEEVEWLLSLFDRSVFQQLKFVTEMLQKQEDKGVRLFEVWFSVVRDIFLIQANLEHLVRHSYKLENLRSLAQRIGRERIRRLIQGCKEAIMQVKANVNPRLVFEYFVISLK